MLRIEPKQFNVLSHVVYRKIPKNHMLRKLEEALDFSFINEMLADSYCIGFGRPAKEPELLMRLLFLKHINNLSDVQVIEQATINMAWMWFLGLNLEDQLPHSSLLAKFRTQRLAEYDLDDIIVEIIRQCKDTGLVKSDDICVDATHMEANTKKKIPERILKHLAQRIFKALKQDLGAIPAEIDTNIPDFTRMEDHAQAKEVMKQYLLQIIAKARPIAGEKTLAAIAEAEEIITDELFLVQRGIRSLVDKDARVGRKTKDTSFYGYKTEFTMLAEDRLITAVSVQSGEKVDGNNFAELLEKTLESGIQPQQVYGDKAYFRADVLAAIEKHGAEPIIPVSESAYRINEELFSYNKDSDQWFCHMGNYSVKKKHCVRKKEGKDYYYYRFTFDKEQCLGCPHRAECLGKAKGKARVLIVGGNAHKLWSYSQKEKTEEFKKAYKRRASIEWKNAELKRFHGLARATGYGLKAVTTQAKLVAIAVNLKRIAALVGLKNPTSTSANTFCLLSARLFSRLRPRLMPANLRAA